MSLGQRRTHRIMAPAGTRRVAEWHALLAVFLAACGGSTPAPAPAPSPVSEPSTVASQRAPATQQGDRSRNQQVLPKDARPTVAVLYFNNGAIARAADYEPLRKGMADMLITELSRNQNLRIVERDQLQAVLEEQKLATTKNIDKETAVRIGKLLSAHHMIFGGFVVLPGGTMRIDARAVNVETSEIEQTETASDQADNLLTLLPTLADKLNEHLHLGPIVREAGQTAPKTGDLRYLITYARAMDAQDNREKDRAVALYKEFLRTSPPTLLVAQRKLAEDRVRKLEAAPH